MVLYSIIKRREEQERIREQAERQQRYEKQQAEQRERSEKQQEKRQTDWANGFERGFANGYSQGWKDAAIYARCAAWYDRLQSEHPELKDTLEPFPEPDDLRPSE